jgi:hypothetical protein
MITLGVVASSRNSRVYTLRVGEGNKSQLEVPTFVQRNPINGVIIHETSQK